MPEELSTKKPQGRRGTGSLFQKPKGNGRWHIQYYVPVYDAATGQARAERKREYCGLPHAQAQKRLADRLGKISRGEQFDSGRPRSVADLYTALYTHTENNLPPGSRKLKGMGWKWEHLQPVFAHMRADLVNSALIEEYKKQRRNEGAALATLQRELAMLRRMFRYGKQTGTVHNVPHFGLVKENNARKGYVEQAVYERMAVEAMKEGLWLRALLETAYTYGWRKGELTGLQVGQLEFGSRPTMRLYDSKNGEGRVVPVMSNVLPLLGALCEGKKLTDQMFTRDDGSPVKEFRAAWQNMCIRAGVPCPDGTPSRFVCRKCGAVMDAGTATCQIRTKDEDGYERKCGGKRKYIGLL
ncbi:MAG TPA: tyrosine-type recombinase/integrase, partial [Terracidiphilus sp.]